MPRTRTCGSFQSLTSYYSAHPRCAPTMSALSRCHDLSTPSWIQKAGRTHRLCFGLKTAPLRPEHKSVSCGPCSLHLQSLKSESQTSQNHRIAGDGLEAIGRLGYAWTWTLANGALAGLRDSGLWTLMISHGPRQDKRPPLIWIRRRSDC